MKYLLIVLAVTVFSTSVKAEIASWYGPGFHGKRTASGEIFNRYGYTAAHRSLPFGSRVRVCNRSKCVIVRINDRGPFIKGRSIDLSEAAARKIGCKGLCRVTLRRL
jgi:rare lipoprotein A